MRDSLKKHYAHAWISLLLMAIVTVSPYISYALPLTGVVASSSTTTGRITESLDTANDPLHESAREDVLINRGLVVDETETSGPDVGHDEYKPCYSVHVQGVGWMKPVSMGETAGTVGQHRRVEALKIQLVGPNGESLPILTQVHVSGTGWQEWVDSGSAAGTVGQSRAIEAIRFKLVDPISHSYSVWYRVHSQEFGWLDWACDGAAAGSVGYGRRVEALQVCVLPKGEVPAGSCDNPFYDRSDEPPSLCYSAHASRIGWLPAVQDSETSGTTGRSLPMEALKASVNWYGHDASLELRSHVAGDGWLPWSVGRTGTTGQSKRMEAVQMRLRGEASDQFDIWYSVHVASIGWLGWAVNGAPAGTTGSSRAIEAIRIQLLPKGSAAPGNIEGAYIGDSEKFDITSNDIYGTPHRSKVAASVSIGSEGEASLSTIKLSIFNNITDGSVRYRVLQQFGAWSVWGADGEQVGYSGDPLKGISIELSGALSSKYDIWYQVHDSQSGWLGWAANGDSSGSAMPGTHIDSLRIVLQPKNAPAPGPDGDSFLDGLPKGSRIAMQGHIARLGWQTPIYGDGVIGTTGQSLSLQAIRLKVCSELAGDIEISCHVSKTGWQDWAPSGSLSGTTGRDLPIEAVRIRLSGQLAEEYSVYYRIHSAKYGWLGWAHDGDDAGTVGLALQAEALEVKLVKRGDSGTPDSSVPPVVSKPVLTSRAHVSTIGWLGQDSEGRLIGTTGKKLRLEGFKLSVGSDVEGGIAYSAHVQDIGWQPEVHDGALAGTTGRSKRVEAIKVNLTGVLSEYFDVWYRVHVENYGWLGWTKNGNPAGTSKIGYRAEALEVRLLPKGSKAPGPTSRPFTDKPAVPSDQLAMLRLANMYGSNTNWLIMVNTTTCRVGIYRGARGMWTQQAYWLCTVGAPATPTILGQYTVGAKGYVFGRGYSCYYYTQFCGDYLFHSILYDQGTFRVQDGRLGQHLSHGCIRLSLSNAKWIWDNIPAGTKVVTYR